jgi:hypothetical protein
MTTNYTVLVPEKMGTQFPLTTLRTDDHKNELSENMVETTQ